jgi:homoserine kinase
MPASAALVAELRVEGVPAVISGAGPTVLALSTRSARTALLVERSAGGCCRSTSRPAARTS